MKKIMMIMAVMVTIATRAAAMSYTEARTEALFLTDKMAYELNLNARQYEAVYEINLDYMMSLVSHTDILGSSWVYRNYRLGDVLDRWQYDRYMAVTYFYRPVVWTNNRWHFSVYTHYTDRHKFFRPRPHAFDTYRGPGNHHVAVAPPAHNNHNNVHHPSTHNNRPTPPPTTHNNNHRPTNQPTVHNTNTPRPTSTTRSATTHPTRTNNAGGFGKHK